MWKSRNKDLVTAICGCDVDIHGDGNKVLVVGFQSGALEVRKDISGDILHQTKIEDAGQIAKIFYYDYRMNGQKQVVVVTTTGKIQGFSLTTDASETKVGHDEQSKEASEKQLELNRKKIELTNKIQGLQEANQKLQT